MPSPKTDEQMITPFVLAKDIHASAALAPFGSNQATELIHSIFIQ
jgi:hypothetical protein